jgi:hypothetical protein
MEERMRNLRVYLAGKITKGPNWRSEAVDSPHRDWDRTRPCSFSEIKEALDPNSVIEICDVDIIGPFFVSCDHGCAHGTKTHAVAGCADFDDLAGLEDVQKRVHAVNVARIKRASFVFACINEVDCFGTIAEIGLAYGAGVPVHLFFGEGLTLEQRYDFWFVAQFAAHVHERVSIEHAFARALRIERATPRIGSHRLKLAPN